MLLTKEERTLLRERVKNLRQSGGRPEIAIRAGISVSTINRIINMKKAVRKHNYAAFLGGMEKLEEEQAAALAD